MDITQQKTAFRNDTFRGDGSNDLESVMAFEILELGNTDIPETLLDRDLIKDPELRKKTQSVIDHIDENGGPGFYNENDDTPEDKDARKLIPILADEIRRVTNKNIRYVLWLAEKNAVIEHYSMPEDDPNDILTEYPTSGIVISDLGYDGALFGYENIPKPVINT